MRPKNKLAAFRSHAVLTTAEMTNYQWRSKWMGSVVRPGNTFLFSFLVVDDTPPPHHNYLGMGKRQQTQGGNSFVEKATNSRLTLGSKNTAAPSLLTIIRC